MEREALKLALEALENPWNAGPDGIADAITAIKEALAQPAQEQALLDAIVGGTGVMLGDKRIDPASIYKQPAQEPVTFENWHKANYVQNLERYGDTYKNNHVRCRHQGWLGAQSSSPQREWVGLTEEETSGFTQHEMTVVKYVSKVLQEKNT